MNTETTHDQNTLISIGARLRSAREQLGLSQQIIAEQLCLKVSTVRDIEEDKAPDDLALTFLNGYIRAYARLVQIPEVELLSMMQVSLAKTARVAPIQSFSLIKYHKKRDSWLVNFTWLILFTVIGITITWWWQNYRMQQKEISMTYQKVTESKKNDNTKSTSLSGKNITNINKIQIPALSNKQIGMSVNSLKELKNQQFPQSLIKNKDTIDISSQFNQNTETISSASVFVSDDIQSQNNRKIISSLINNKNILEMKFQADCWLEVNDATNRKLFSGLQHKGDNLFLTGQTPYKVKIGAPEAVQIQFQGKTIDLSRFIETNQIAHLIINAE